MSTDLAIRDRCCSTACPVQALCRNPALNFVQKLCCSRACTGASELPQVQRAEHLGGGRGACSSCQHAAVRRNGQRGTRPPARAVAAASGAVAAVATHQVRPELRHRQVPLQGIPAGSLSGQMVLSSPSASLYVLRFHPYDRCAHFDVQFSSLQRSEHDWSESSAKVRQSACAVPIQHLQSIHSRDTSAFERTTIPMLSHILQGQTRHSHSTLEPALVAEHPRAVPGTWVTSSTPMMPSLPAVYRRDPSAE